MASPTGLTTPPSQTEELGLENPEVIANRAHPASAGTAKTITGAGFPPTSSSEVPAPERVNWAGEQTALTARPLLPRPAVEEKGR
jgi:hypothetical protein